MRRFLGIQIRSSNHFNPRTPVFKVYMHYRHITDWVSSIFWSTAAPEAGQWSGSQSFTLMNHVRWSDDQAFFAGSEGHEPSSSLISSGWVSHEELATHHEIVLQMLTKDRVSRKAYAEFLSRCNIFIKVWRRRRMPEKLHRVSWSSAISLRETVKPDSKPITNGVRIPILCAHWHLRRWGELET